MSARSTISRKSTRPSNPRRRARALDQTVLTTALRRAIRGFYDCYQKEKWELCYHRIDPQLIEAKKVDFDCYRDSLAAFKQRYGEITIRVVDIGEIHTSKRDKRPFAFASIIWRDRLADFHVFRERWVFDKGRWYTRVAGLVTYLERSPD